MKYSIFGKTTTAGQLYHLLDIKDTLNLPVHIPSVNQIIKSSLLLPHHQVDMPEIRKKYKEKYNLDLADELRAKPHPTLKCLLELVNKGGPNSKKVSPV